MATLAWRFVCPCQTLARQTLKSVRINITQPVRGFRHNKWRTQIDLYRRRIEQGPEPERPRSFWPNWNYDAEIFAFGKRLGENLNTQTLKEAFTDISYIEAEKAKRQELVDEGEKIEISLIDNQDLANQGSELATEYIKGYLRHHLPLYPEEGICAICSYLMSDECLHNVSKKLGTKDLILCSDFPIEIPTMTQALKAVIGAIARDQGKERAQLFVQDFLLTQLVGKEISEYWDMYNPMGILIGVLEKQGMAPPEPRLLWQSGCETVLAVYEVGIYSDRKLIGRAPGETVSIAEDMAARDALKRIFGLSMDRKPFSFGKEGHSLKIDTLKMNKSVFEYTRQEVSHLQ